MPWKVTNVMDQKIRFSGRGAANMSALCREFRMWYKWLKRYREAHSVPALPAAPAQLRWKLGWWNCGGTGGEAKAAGAAGARRRALECLAGESILGRASWGNTGRNGRRRNGSNDPSPTSCGK